MSGKSEFVLKVVSSLLLPKKWGNIDPLGNGYNVVFFDLDLNFNMVRLMQLMTEYLKQIITADDDPNEIESLLNDSMERMWILRCDSTSQFKVSLLSLNRRISRIESTLDGLSNKRWLFVIDSMDSFYWVERHENKTNKNAEPVSY